MAMPRRPGQDMPEALAAFTERRPLVFTGR